MNYTQQAEATAKKLNIELIILDLDLLNEIQ